MDLESIFSIAVGKSKLDSSISLAKKIFYDNKHLIKNVNGLGTNFKLQTNNKHIIDEDYVFLKDVEELKQIILDQSVSYLKEIGWYINFIDYELTNFWLNEYLPNSGLQDPHSHPGLLISGTYYVEVPDNCGPIIFTNPIKSLPQELFPKGRHIEISKFCFNQFNSSTWTFLPKQGEIYFWPSFLVHEVPSTNFVGVRRSISFDVSMTGVNKIFK